MESEVETSGEEKRERERHGIVFFFFLMERERHGFDRLLL